MDIRLNELLSTSSMECQHAAIAGARGASPDQVAGPAFSTCCFSTGLLTELKSPGNRWQMRGPPAGLHGGDQDSGMIRSDWKSHQHDSSTVVWMLLGGGVVGGGPGDDPPDASDDPQSIMVTKEQGRVDRR